MELATNLGEKLLAAVSTGDKRRKVAKFVTAAAKRQREEAAERQRKTAEAQALCDCFWAGKLALERMERDAHIAAWNEWLNVKAAEQEVEAAHFAAIREDRQRERDARIAAWNKFLAEKAAKQQAVFERRTVCAARDKAIQTAIRLEREAAKAARQASASFALEAATKREEAAGHRQDFVKLAAQLASLRA